MPAHRRFLNRYITTISMERKEREIAESLGITLSDALRIGLNVMINTRISDGDRRLTDEILADFLEIQKKDVEDFKAYIRMQDAAQQTLVKMAETLKETRKPKELVRVWDRAREAYVQIPRDDVNPEWHILSPKAEVGTQCE